MKLIGTVLLALSISGFAQAAEIGTTVTLCKGKLQNGGFEKDSQLLVLIQDLFPSGNRSLKIAIDGDVQVDELVTESVAPNPYNSDFRTSFTSKSASLSIKHATMSHESNTVTLRVNGKLIDGAKLDCDLQ